MGLVRETEAWYLSKATNKYTEYELLVFTPLLVLPVGISHQEGGQQEKQGVAVNYNSHENGKKGQRKVENRSGRRGNRIECAEGYGRGQISKIFRDEVAKRKCDSQYMMGI